MKLTRHYNRLYRMTRQVKMEVHDDRTRRLLYHLGQGGGAQYFFHQPDKQSVWFLAGQPPSLPSQTDWHFGVHPTLGARGARQRARKVDICAINALYAEIDANDHGGTLSTTCSYVENLHIPPSAAWTSGTGVHCVWLLGHTVLINDTNRDMANQLQARFVATVGGDPGAKDLSHTLRLPGTLNGKYSPLRPAEWLWYDEDLFLLVGLTKFVDTFGPEAKPARPRAAASSLFPNSTLGWGDRRGSAYGRRVLEAELAALATVPKGNRNASLNAAAFSLGCLVGGGLLTVDQVIRPLYETAIRLGTDESFNERQIISTIRSGLTAGHRQPRHLPNASR